jgi:hypothetical protein
MNLKAAPCRKELAEDSGSLEVDAIVDQERPHIVGLPLITYVRLELIYCSGDLATTLVADLELPISKTSIADRLETLADEFIGVTAHPAAEVE